MILTETEYQFTLGRVAAFRHWLADERASLKEAGLNADEIKRATDPMVTFYLQMEEEAEFYERTKRGEFIKVENLHGLGCLMISLRIAQGMSQSELAQRLGVPESQVSHDERSGYYGITVERAAKILDALNVRLHTKAEIGLPFPLAMA